MDMYADNAGIWDLNQASQYAQINDDDFLALFKQYPPTDNTYTQNVYLPGGGINPQNVNDFALPGLTPPSDDSSPSPPSYSETQSSRRASLAKAVDASVLKRKASDDSLDEEPVHKTASAPGKGGRRKSTAALAAAPEDNRLLKRKEQNRAAQRAFRERKEKHVKDLEDKVAALEAKNVEAVSENDNLRDLLSRLQDENVNLKRFTFSVPKSSSPSVQSPSSIASGSSPSASIHSPPSSTKSPTSPNNGIDFSSLTSFDPAMLNLLDESPQNTATDSAMRMNFGFGNDSSPFASGSTGPYTTIASNPAFMSFADSFDSAAMGDAGTSSALDFNFDLWNPTANNSPSQPLDEMFGLSAQSPGEFATGATGRSPVIHQATPSVSASWEPTPPAGECTSTGSCPKTRGDLSNLIDRQGASPFTMASPPASSSSSLSPFTSALSPSTPTIRKSSDALGSIVACEGTKFPMTKQSDQNVEVLSAWRTITSNPRFKDTDINELCSAFTSKARCDGTKVVLEPSGVHHILDALSNRKSG